MDLTDEELEATRRLNGTKRKVLVNVNVLEQEIKEIDDMIFEGVIAEKDRQFYEGKKYALNCILDGLD